MRQARLFLYALLPLFAACQVWKPEPTRLDAPTRVQGEVTREDGGLVLRPCNEQRRFNLVDGADSAVARESRDLFADGAGRSVRAHIVAKQEFAGYWEYLLDEAIFIAPAHPSWGGAALVGADGTLLGIGSLRLQMSGDDESVDINMAVPINLLPPILDDLLARGRANRPPRPWLGVFSAESDGKVVVMSVADGSPAAQAGLRQGDIISDVRDGEVDGLADFYRKLWQNPAGSEIPLRVVRDGRETWLRVKSADRNSFLKKPQLQ